MEHNPQQPIEGASFENLISPRFWWWLWATDCVLLALFGLVILWSALTGIYPRPVAGLGIAMVISALIVWLSRAWRDRHRNIATMPGLAAVGVTFTMDALFMGGESYVRVALGGGPIVLAVALMAWALTRQAERLQK
jgi:hypothetical protein